MKRKLCSALLAGVITIGAFAGYETGNVLTSQAEENLPVDEEGNPSPFGKYEEPITVEIVRSLNPTDELPEGESSEDNYYTRYIKDNMNVDIKIKWQAASSDYNQKLKLAIAANDLPDILVVGASELKTLMKSDMLEDLTPYYDTYLSDTIKKGYDQTNGKALDAVSKDGKIYALPDLIAEGDGYNLMWIRQDWLDELGLEAPTTVEELETVAKAFVDNQMGGENTVGLLGPSAGGMLYHNFLVSSNISYTFEGIFQAYKAFPGFWVKDENGDVVYGSTTQETKAALAKLQQMYADGILDQEIGVRASADEAWKSGKAGILFSQWWFGYSVNDCIANDPDAEWVAYASPLAEDGKWYAKLGNVSSAYCVVRKGFEHPEVAMLLNNYLRRDESQMIQETSLGIGYYPGRINIATPDETEYSTKQLRKQLKGEAVDEYVSSEYKLLDADLATLEACLTNYEDLGIENWNRDETNFGRLYSLLIGTGAEVDAEESGQLVKVYSEIYTQTETMSQKWTNLKRKEDETFLKIIIGEADIDSFDTFVEEWKAEGGDEIVAEVREMVQ